MNSLEFNDKLKEKYAEVSSIFKNLPKDNSSSIRELVGIVFPNLDEDNINKIIVFAAMLVNIERKHLVAEVQEDFLNVNLPDLERPSYIG